MRKNILVSLVLLHCLIPLNSPGQATISIQDAIRLLRSNYPEIKSREAALKAREYQVNETWSQLVPSLKLHEQLTYATANALPGSYFSYGVVIPTSGGIAAENNNTPVYGSISLAQLEWTPFTSGQFRAGLDYSRSQEQLAAAEKQLSEFSLEMKLLETIFNLQSLSDFRKIQESFLEKARNIYEISKAGAISGLKAGADTAFATTELSRARILLDETERSYQVQKVYVAELIGKNPADFEIQYPDSAPAFDVAAAYKPQAHPLFLVYKAREQSERSKLDIARHSYFPRLSLLGGIWGRGSGISPVNQSLRNTGWEGADLTRFNYAIGAAMTFNILDFPRYRSSVNVQKAILESVHHKTEQEEIELNAEQQIAVLNVNHSRKVLAEAPVQLRAAKQAYAQVKARYESGLTNLLDLTQSLYNLNRAEIEEKLARNNSLKAYLQKYAAEGNLDEFTNLITK